MGVPVHYSRDIARRCRALIAHLRPVIENGLPDDHQFGGPLVTTFLLAMATPMIVLPVERIFKPASGRAVAADDRQVDPMLAEQVNDVLGPTRRFADAPFFTARRWSYVRNFRPFKVADWWPDDLLQMLGSEKAFADAEQASAQRILLDLRNALSHGGIVYLDSHGQSTDDPTVQAAMLAFASARIEDGQVTRINVLRTHQDDFCKFVMNWAEWLAASPIRDLLDTRDPLAA